MGAKSSTALRSATGHDYDEWFRRLDEWGAANREYREIARWLSGEGLSDWWAQKLTVEYEQLRGARKPGARRDGTFAGGASKSVPVPLGRAYAAFADPAVRGRWLPELELTERASRPNRSMRFDVADGSRVTVYFAALDDTRTRVAVEQERLVEAAAASRAKAEWRRRLSDLERLLEA